MAERDEQATQVRDLPDAWTQWLGRWTDEVPDDFPVVFYEDDGTDLPDEWENYPHLAIREDVQLPGENAPRALVWLVGVDGWADPREIGWQGVAELIAFGCREYTPQEAT